VREHTVKCVWAQRIKWGGGETTNRMEKTETMRNITEWNPTRIRSKKKKSKKYKGDKVLNGLKKLKVKNWTYLVKDKKSLV
jgi:hypothetical protein